jgi:hypothetical protein
MILESTCEGWVGCGIGVRGASLIVESVWMRWRCEEGSRGLRFIMQFIVESARMRWRCEEGSRGLRFIMQFIVESARMGWGCEQK